MEGKEHKIVVLGSASGDFFLLVGMYIVFMYSINIERMPLVGETLDAHSF